MDPKYIQRFHEINEPGCLVGRERFCMARGLFGGFPASPMPTMPLGNPPV